MRFFKIALIAISFTLCSNLNAQKGKNGNLLVSSTVIVNEYTTLTANATSGSTSITVSNSSLNSHSRFSASLAAGDLVMIIQLQGATINGIPNPLSPTIAKPNDSSWGAVTNYNNCGYNEIREVSSVPNSTTIDLSCPLTNNYTSSGIVQVVRIPRLIKLTINSGGTISCDPWNGTVGGIAALEVDSNTIINSGGQINTSGNGFRGGQLVNGGINYGATDFSTSNQIGAEKGEGIAGYLSGYNVFGGMYGCGSAANAGGGGDGVNAAGGGGSNAGIISDWTNGDGIPDTSTANNITAWKLEYSWFPKFSNSGGGRGGYTWSNNLHDPLITSPGSSSWSGDQRRSVGGRGGRPLDYSTGRLFLGGGGGAGDENNGNGGAGGNGGGMIYLISYGTISGGGSILSNGNHGGGDANYYGDGAGGAGGGGTILINSLGNISGINISANGGAGGNQTFSASNNEAEGPGGGGGGGYIATTIASSVTETVAGGINGTTLSFPTFPPNGATKGGNGLISNLPGPGMAIQLKDSGFCQGDSAYFHASVSLYTGNGSVKWKWIFPGGNPSTSTLQNPSVSYSSSGTYTVTLIDSACSGQDTISKIIHITVVPAPSVTLSAKDSICKGSPTLLTASGGGTYLWNTGATTSSITASPSITTTYTVSVSNGVCTKDTSVKVTVNPIPIISLSGIKSLCPGNNTIITATGGGTYQWSNGSTNDTINVSPTLTSTYTLGVTDKGCIKDTSIVITINPKPNVTVTPSSASICKGTGTPLLANGAITYSWSPSAGLSCTVCSNPTANPVSNATYSVIGTSAAGCKDTVSVPITVNPVPVASISGKDTMCLGNSTTLNASGGGTYSWNTGSSSSSILVSPTVTTTYTVTVSNGLCTKDTTNVVIVLPPFSVKVIGDSACKGIGSIITASSGTSYKWIPGGATTSSISVAPPVSTTYSVIINGPCGTDTLSALVFVEPTPVIKVSGNDSVCSGTNTVLSVSGANTYVWSTGNTNTSITVVPTSAITYTVTGSNGKCHGDTTITVKVTPKPTATITGLSKVCKGDSITLTATGGGSYIWSNNTTGSSVTIVPSKDTTVYVVVVTKGCADTAYHTITIPATKGVTACCDTTIGPGGTAVLNANGVIGYVWSPSANVDCYTCAKTTAIPGSSTTYTITGTDSNGCVSSTTIIVDIGCFDFFVPNVFTPNNDNINDLFVIHAEYEPTYSIEIYDRWGVKMFSSTDPSDYWNGKINNTGAKVPDGVYYYIIKAECGGKDYNHNGFVQVIR